MASPRTFSITTLAQDLADDSAAYVGVYCGRASNIKSLQLGLRGLCLGTLVVGGYYVANVSHWLPGVEPPLWLSVMTWGLVACAAAALLARWPAKLEAYEQAAHEYTQLYYVFTRLARGDYNWQGRQQQAVFSEALEGFHRHHKQVACRPISYDELARSRANFKE